MGSLLALDLSTYTGWAWWETATSRPVCATERLPKTHNPEDYGKRCWHLHEWLSNFLMNHKTDAIAYESPFIPFSMFAPKEGETSFNTTLQTLRLQISLAATIETVATCWKKRCVEVATQSAKTALVGYGRKPKDAPPKFDWGKVMLVAATRQGYRVSNDHEADAIAVGKVAYEHLWGLEV